jgi:hypothetical protein
MVKDDPMKYYDARTGFTGKTLTHSQFDEAWDIANIIKRNIEKTGSFVKKLADYSYTFSRDEQFDQLRGETILRDLFKDRYGVSMNQMREGFMEREKNLSENARSVAREAAYQTLDLIRDGETQPFYRAYDTAGYGVTEVLHITESKAKELMKDTFYESEGRDLYEVGKEVEKEFHEPAREAAREKYKQEKVNSKSQSNAKARVRA